MSVKFRMKKWRESASLIAAVCSKQNLPPMVKISKIAKPEQDYGILAIRRNSSSSFMPAKVVFPGGALSNEDYSPQWENLFKKITTFSAQEIHQKLNYPLNKYPAINDNISWSLHPDIALRICAIRETFEECGLLLAINKNQYTENKSPRLVGKLSESIISNCSSEIMEWRNQAHKDPSNFIRMCETLEILPNIWALDEWNNWLTPHFHSQSTKQTARFDTMFYVCCLEGETYPSIQSDNAETSKVYWSSPSELLKQNEQDESKSSMAPPQVYELTDIQHFSTLEELKLAAHARTYSKKTRHRLLPVACRYDSGFVLLFPGDYLYPTEPESCQEVQIIEEASEDVASVDRSKPKHRMIFKEQQLNHGLIVKYS